MSLQTLKRSDDRKVIGYFASDGAHLLLDGKACIVTGAATTMQRLIDNRHAVDGFGNTLVMQSRKIRFAAIMQGLEKGGSYAFDQTAYALFYPVANQYGYALGEEKFDTTVDTDLAGGIPLIVISR